MVNVVEDLCGKVYINALYYTDEVNEERLPVK